MHGATCIFWADLTPFSLKVATTARVLAIRQLRVEREAAQRSQGHHPRPGPFIADAADAGQLVHTGRPPSAIGTKMQHRNNATPQQIARADGTSRHHYQKVLGSGAR